MLRALNPSPLRVRRALPRRRATPQQPPVRRPSRGDRPWRGAPAPALGVDEEPAATGGGGELDAFLEAVPARMWRGLARHPEVRELVMDLGRCPIARFPSGDWVISRHQPVTADDLRQAVSKVGEFSEDNRSRIDHSLHRISAIRNWKAQIIGLTCRVGRAIPGCAEMIRDLVLSGGSILVIGPPRAGKTTLIREIARVLADEGGKRVIVVDTSNEIGGDGDVPHSGIGRARRMQVPKATMQHNVMIEAVENHMPEVVVVDEIGTKLEAMAASTIAQRGVQLVGTAHGVTIESVIQNPCLQMLVGGIASASLGDEEAKKRKVQKTILKRKGPPTFSCAVEMISRTECRVHRKLETTVDAILAGKPPKFEAHKMNTKPTESERRLVISDQEYEMDKVYTRTNKGLSSGGSKEKSTQSPKPLSASGPTFSKKKMKKKSRSRAGLRAMVAQVGSTTGTPETIEGLRRSPRLKHLLEMVTKAWLHLLQAQPGAPPLRSRPPFLPTKREVAIQCGVPLEEVSPEKGGAELVKQ